MTTLRTIRQIHRTLPALGLVLLLPGLGCDVEDPMLDDEGESEGYEDEAEIDDVEFRIVDANPVPAGELMGVVRIQIGGGVCSGMLIADDTVLSAAHCFCTDDLIGGNDCVSTATVNFLDDPNTPGNTATSIAGTVVVHPSYNPSWTDNQFENDLALITLDSVAPAYVEPFEIAESNPSSGTTVQIAGYGRTGNGCNGSLGTLNSDVVTINGYEDGSKIMRFNDPVFCSGDSGGAIMNLGETTLYGVHSTTNLTILHGWVNKSIAVAPYRDWIKENTCSTSFWHACDGKGPICECGEGQGDCDSDLDCEGSLQCTHDVGAQFGMHSVADVCLEPGPIEGVCTCENSGFANMCIAGYNDCTPGFSPVCTPASGSCGGCSCQ